MNIIILGPQGSGKGTQAELLAKKYGLEHIDVGRFLREVAAMETGLGKEVYEIINVRKELVPDHILEKILQLKLNDIDREQGVILDGMPRNLEQAGFLEKIFQSFGKKIEKVFFLDVSEEESIKRISKRWICAKCKAQFIMGKDIRNAREKCAKCGGGLEQRIDDTPEGIRKRLEVFRKETIPVLDYYKEKGMLVKIDGAQPIEKALEEITRQIEKI